jgi:hypothetical protein
MLPISDILKRERTCRHIKEIMGVKEKPDIIDIIEKKMLHWYGHVKRMQEERLPKLIMEWIPGERRGRPKKNLEGRRTSGQGNKTSRSRSVVKQKGMVFGFRKTATAVVGPEIEEEERTCLQINEIRCLV